MYTLILASFDPAAGTPELCSTDYATPGEVLEAVADIEALDADELAALDDALAASVPGSLLPLTYLDGDNVVTFGAVVRA